MVNNVTPLDPYARGFLSQHSANGYVHRLAIFDTHGEIVRVVSMSDAVRFLALRADKLGGLADMNLRLLGFVSSSSSSSPPTTAAVGGGGGALVTVAPNVPAIEAFALMCNRGVSGIGILDNGQGLIANISASDLRCIQPEHFGMLGLPVAEFLALLHGTSYAGFSHAESQNRGNPFFAKMSEGGFRRTGPFLVVARPDDTLRKVLGMITEHGVHRVYVCEADSMRPTGVMTLTDVLRLASRAAQEVEQQEDRGDGGGGGGGGDAEGEEED